MAKAELLFGAERNLRRNDADQMLFDSDGVTVTICVSIHVAARYAERYRYAYAYALAAAERRIKELLSNQDLFDMVVTTKETTFTIYDEQTGAVFPGQLWLDRDLPDVFLSTYWYGKPFHASENDKQIIVSVDGVVCLGNIYAAMMKKTREL